MHISKEGDLILRTLLVQGAHHICGLPFGADSDLRRWGLKLAERRRENWEEASGNCRDPRQSWRCCSSAVGAWRGLRTAAE